MANSPHVLSRRCQPLGRYDDHFPVFDQSPLETAEISPGTDLLTFFTKTKKRMSIPAIPLPLPLYFLFSTLFWPR